MPWPWSIADIEWRGWKKPVRSSRNGNGRNFHPIFSVKIFLAERKRKIRIEEASDFIRRESWPSDTSRKSGQRKKRIPSPSSSHSGRPLSPLVAVVVGLDSFLVSHRVRSLVAASDNEFDWSAANNTNICCCLCLAGVVTRCGFQPHSNHHNFDIVTYPHDEGKRINPQSKQMARLRLSLDGFVNKAERPVFHSVDELERWRRKRKTVNFPPKNGRIWREPSRAGPIVKSVKVRGAVHFRQWHDRKLFSFKNLISFLFLEENNSLNTRVSCPPDVAGRVTWPRRSYASEQRNRPARRSPDTCRPINVLQRSWNNHKFRAKVVLRNNRVYVVTNQSESIGILRGENNVSHLSLFRQKKDRVSLCRR